MERLKETSIKRIKLDKRFLVEFQEEFNKLLEFLHQGKHSKYFISRAIAASLPNLCELSSILGYSKDQLGGIVFPDKIIITFDYEGETD